MLDDYRHFVRVLLAEPNRDVHLRMGRVEVYDKMVFPGQTVLRCVIQGR